VDHISCMGGEKMIEKLKKAWGWLKWVIGAVGFFWAYGVIKKRFEKDSIDIKFKNAKKEIAEKKKKLEKEKKIERNRIKNMDKRSRILDIKRLLHHSKNDTV